MECLHCNQTYHLERLYVCLNQECDTNIFCGECYQFHNSLHRNRTKATLFLKHLLKRLPDRQVLHNIKADKILQELENNFEKSKKLFKQLKESVLRSIDMLMNKVNGLQNHLHKSYSTYHSKIIQMEDQGVLVEDVLKNYSFQSLLSLIKSYNDPNPIESTSSTAKIKDFSSFPSNASQEKFIKIFDKFEEALKEVNQFNEFTETVLERELDKSSQALYVHLDGIQKFLTNKIIMSQRKTLTSTNKFIDSLQPLFTKEEQVICHKNNMPVQALVLSQKQGLLISASFDCNIIGRDMISLAEVFSIKAHTQWIRALSIQEHSICNSFEYPNAVLVSCGDDKQVMGWGIKNYSSPSFEAEHSQILETSQIIQRIPFHVNQKASLLCTISKNRMAVCCGPTDHHQIFIYDISSGECLKVLRGHKKYVRCILYLAEKNQLCSGSDDGIVGVWDLRESKSTEKETIKFLHRLQTSISPVQALLFENNKQLLCIGCQDGKILLYSMSDRIPKLLRSIQSSINTQVSSLCLLNPTYFAAAVGKCVLVFEFLSGTLVNTVNCKNSGNISNIAYSSQLQKMYVGDVRGQLSSYSVLII